MFIRFPVLLIALFYYFIGTLKCNTIKVSSTKS